MSDAPIPRPPSKSDGRRDEAPSVAAMRSTTETMAARPPMGPDDESLRRAETSAVVAEMHMGVRGAWSIAGFAGLLVVLALMRTSGILPVGSAATDDPAASPWPRSTLALVLLVVGAQVVMLLIVAEHWVGPALATTTPQASLSAAMAVRRRFARPDGQPVTPEPWTESYRVGSAELERLRRHTRYLFEPAIRLRDGAVTSCSEPASTSSSSASSCSG